jgi:hypothetical protein
LQTNDEEDILSEMSVGLAKLQLLVERLDKAAEKAASNTKPFG